MTDYQSEASRYRKRSTYLKNRVSRNKKHTMDSQKPKRETKYKRKSSNYNMKIIIIIKSMGKPGSK